MIRVIKPDDLEELKRIHGLYFADEFKLPDFFNYLCVFVVEDEKGIITFGGIRDIAEIVAVTNLERKPLDRSRALYRILDASAAIVGNLGYDQLYAFSQNPKWTKRLIRSGFRLPQGQALILDL